MYITCFFNGHMEYPVIFVYTFIADWWTYCFVIIRVRLAIVDISF